ncbi:MAG TPA: metal-dependent hydrolase [Thermoanaerobaculia bacterium]|nr:metal-dependent hydrolase [Thermoanaerobaculia bacterium]
MASAISHPAAVLALRPWLGEAVSGPRAVVLAAVCSIAPDADAIGFWMGVPYDSPLGHRGLTHSIAFALAIAAAVVAIGFPRARPAVALFGFLFLCTASHGLFDAMTDGGLGVAFWAPFDNTRYFLPWRPIHVSPFSLTGFFGARGLEILGSEVVAIWIPCLALGALGWGVRASIRRSKSHA